VKQLQINCIPNLYEKEMDATALRQIVLNFPNVQVLTLNYRPDEDDDDESNGHPYCSITDKTLMHLYQLKKLRKVTVRRFKGFSGIFVGLMPPEAIMRMEAVILKDCPDTISCLMDDIIEKMGENAVDVRELQTA
jgi:hypothetical protein